VDDDLDVAQTTTSILRRAGLRVQTAISPDYALALCGRVRFDAVVLGDSNGRDFLERVDEIGPVVICSAATPEVLDEALRNHAGKVFAVKIKPCDPPDLIEVVHAAVAEGRRRSLLT
jgi:DNA-binding NtrC family response regulator